MSMEQWSIDDYWRKTEENRSTACLKDSLSTATLTFPILNPKLHGDKSAFNPLSHGKTLQNINTND